MGDDKVELDFPSDVDNAVQFEQSEDEGSSLHGKQIHCEICGKNQKATTPLHCYTCINDTKCAEKDAKAQAKEALLFVRKKKKIGGNAFALALYRFRSKCKSFGWQGMVQRSS